jgi:murein DD-endopeptidase MepM/ murein hydrolase activator NlpD
MSVFSDYLETISRINDLGNGLSDDLQKKSPCNPGTTFNVEWLFHCGMLFSSQDKWWGNFKSRHSAHEGIDITFYRTCKNRTHCFDDFIKIPAMSDGVVLNICNDFLARTLVVKQKNIISSKTQIIVLYSHVIPEKNLKPGQKIKKNEIIATICNNDKNPQLPSHLHFSCFEILKNIKPEHLNWDIFSNNLEVNMINPVFL